jgi:hypothetical protein
MVGVRNVCAHTYTCLQWLPESARYHIASGEPEEAYAILKRIADDNGKPMILGRLVETKGVHSATDGEQSRGSIKDLFKTRELQITTPLLWFIW